MSDDNQERATFAEEMLFDSNLKEFAHRVAIIVGLESGGKISAAEAYDRIKGVWKQLKVSKKSLRITDEESADEENHD